MTYTASNNDFQMDFEAPPPLVGALEEPPDVECESRVTLDDEEDVSEKELEISLDLPCVSCSPPDVLPGPFTIKGKPPEVDQPADPPSDSEAPCSDYATTNGLSSEIDCSRTASDSYSSAKPSTYAQNDVSKDSEPPTAEEAAVGEQERRDGQSASQIDAVPAEDTDADAESLAGEEEAVEEDDFDDDFGDFVDAEVVEGLLSNRRRMETGQIVGALSIDRNLNINRSANFALPMDKRVIRGICLYEFKLGTTAKEADEKINAAFGQGCSTIRTAHRWYQKFRNGDESLEEHEGRGRHSDVDEDKLRDVVEEDPHKGTREIAKVLGVSHNTAARHLKEIGKTKKLESSVHLSAYQVATMGAKKSEDSEEWDAFNTVDDSGKAESWSADFDAFGEASSPREEAVEKPTKGEDAPEMESSPVLDELCDSMDLWNVDSEIGGDEAMNITELLDADKPEKSDSDSLCLDRSFDLWFALRIVEDALALKFEWKGSQHGSNLFKTLRVDPNAVGRGSLPPLSTSTVLEPVPFTANGTTRRTVIISREEGAYGAKVVASDAAAANVLPSPNYPVVAESPSIPQADFDWDQADLRNPTTAASAFILLVFIAKK
ncbi:unnamed protein product [Heligmosomoides polygyrus]|uniref:HTH_48 domain-containing protein n=1 Tax=Heligmosomoides polygyrus TaxID=6339 RepID=A0A3P8AN50_HELPZ|nr:unnamed protein product [Heligmosomoides polygyrus]